MKLLFCLLLAWAGQAQVKNTTQLRLPRGLVEVQWLSASTFRLQRCPQLVCASRPDVSEKVDVKFTGKAAHWEFQSDYLVLSVDRKTGLGGVKTARGGAALFQETPGGADFAWTPKPEEVFTGLGPRDEEKLDLRGRNFPTSRPFLYSSAGYGLYFAQPGAYYFQLGGREPRVSGPFGGRLEYFFYYGPTPKEVLTEHAGVVGPIQPISPRYVDGSGRLPPYAVDLELGSLPQLARTLNHASFSAVHAPLVDLKRLPGLMSTFWPFVKGDVSARRAPWIPYLYTYLKEVHDRGLPIYRPLAMQYPEDKAAWTENSTFMIGDELLFSAGPRTYLPRGIWTNFCTDEIFKGRQAIDSPAAGCPMVHNGTIIPLAVAKEKMELHYFPRLGAEFFIAEPGHDHPSQVHASPAGEFLRLEIESLVDREYEWVVHHVSQPLEASGGEALQYDAARRQLRVKTGAKAGSDVILNITLKEPL